MVDVNAHTKCQCQTQLRHLTQSKFLADISHTHTHACECECEYGYTRTYARTHRELPPFHSPLFFEYALTNVYMRMFVSVYVHVSVCICISSEIETKIQRESFHSSPHLHAHT